LLNQESLKI